MISFRASCRRSAHRRAHLRKQMERLIRWGHLPGQPTRLPRYATSCPACAVLQRRAAAAAPCSSQQPRPVPEEALAQLTSHRHPRRPIQQATLQLIPQQSGSNQRHSTLQSDAVALRASCVRYIEVESLIGCYRFVSDANQSTRDRDVRRDTLQVLQDRGQSAQRQRPSSFYVPARLVSFASRAGRGLAGLRQRSSTFQSAERRLVEGLRPVSLAPPRRNQSVDNALPPSCVPPAGRGRAGHLLTLDQIMKYMLRFCLFFLYRFCRHVQLIRHCFRLKQSVFTCIAPRRHARREAVAVRTTPGKRRRLQPRPWTFTFRCVGIHIEHFVPPLSSSLTFRRIRTSRRPRRG